MAPKTSTRSNKPPLSPDPPLENEQIEDISEPNDFWDGWALMKSVPENGWDHHVVYIYRSYPLFEGQTKRLAQLEKINFAVDENYITGKFGGGKFVVYFNNEAHPEDGKFSKRTTVELHGAPPRLYRGQHWKDKSIPEIYIDARAPESIADGVPASAAVPVASSEAALAKIIVDAIESAKKSNVSSEDAAKNAIELIQYSSKKSIEMMAENQKSSAGSMTGNPIADKVLSVALEGMNKKNDGISPDLKAILENQNRLIEKLAENRGGGFSLESLVAILPIIEQFTGKKPDQLLRGIFGSGDAATVIEGSGKLDTNTLLFNALQTLADKGPEMLEAYSRMTAQQTNNALTVMDYQLQHGLPVTGVAGAAPAPGGPPLPPQPALHAAPPAAPPANVVTMRAPAQVPIVPGVNRITEAPAPAVAATKANGAAPAAMTPQQEQATRQFINGLIFPRCIMMYKDGVDPESVAQWVLVGFPDVAQYMTSTMGILPTEQIVTMAKTWPAFAAVANDPQFPEFIRKWANAMFHPEPEPTNENCPKCNQKITEDAIVVAVNGFDYHEACAPDEDEAPASAGNVEEKKGPAVQ